MRYAPGVYSVMNPYGKDNKYDYTVDNMNYKLFGDSIITVVVFNWAYFSPTLYVQRIANHPDQILGNSSAFTT